MGTNYYAYKDTCPHCKRPMEKVHLGKCSYGYKLLFHKSEYIKNFNDFCDFINENEIYDEYNERVNPSDLLELIENIQKRSCHNIDCEVIDGYDFLSAEFC